MDELAAIVPSALDQYRREDKPAAAEDKGKIGQAAFFELMVTQLQNQDPMKPMESGEFLGQIAQFSTVSGIDDLQKSFASLVSSLQSNQALQASTMVGRGVVIASDTFASSPGQPTLLSADLAEHASDVRVTISDASGQLVKQFSLGAQEPGRLKAAFDGLDGAGDALAAGRYAVKFDAVINGKEQALSAAVVTRVDSVSLARDGAAPTLNVDGFGSVAMSDVLEIL
jgi:flagellar basal-body rod modification protein FlgD